MVDRVSACIPEPVFAQAAAFGCPNCNESLFLPQMSGTDAAGDDDEGSRKRKSKNLYVAKIRGPQPCSRGGSPTPFSSSVLELASPPRVQVGRRGCVQSFSRQTPDNRNLGLSMAPGEGQQGPERPALPSAFMRSDA